MTAEAQQRKTMNHRARSIDLDEKWIQRVKACQSSSLTIKEFAEQNKIGAGSLYAWSKRLGLPLRSQDQSEISFIELGSIHQSTMRDTRLYPVEMGAGGITIKTEMPLFQIVDLMKEFA